MSRTKPSQKADYALVTEIHLSTLFRNYFLLCRFHIKVPVKSIKLSQWWEYFVHRKPKIFAPLRQLGIEETILKTRDIWLLCSKSIAKKNLEIKMKNKIENTEKKKIKFLFL